MRQPSDASSGLNPGREPVLRAENITLVYRDGESTVHAVKDVTLSVASGEFVGVLGPSGSGKTSLLYVLSGIRPLTQGQVFLQGRPLYAPGVPREALRRKSFGLVFQQYFLINYLTALENVLVGVAQENGAGRERARTLLDRLGLGGLEHRKPYALSGGQRQRVAIARALVKEPLVLFADEPTANLDHTTGAAVMELLTLNRDGASLVVVSHDETILRAADALYRMWDGALERVR